MNEELDPNLQPLVDVIEGIMSIPDESLNESTIESINGMFVGAFTDTIKKQTMDEVIKSFKDNNLSFAQARASIDKVKDTTKDLIDEIKPSPYKKILLHNLFEQFHNIYEMALNSYKSGDFTMRISLDDGAQVPTYAHEGDAAADLYAAEDITILAHSLSTPVKTGVHVEIPNRMVGLILPRSSIGAKTPLRLSNSTGVIDSTYRGPLGVLYDNIGDEPYEIHKGDRIAQLLIVPCYTFNSNVVDELEETDRGEGGFGSTGK